MSAERKTPRVVLSLPPDSHPDLIRGKFIERDAAPLHTAMRRAMEQQYETFATLDELSRQIRSKPKLAAAAIPHVERAAAALGSAMEQARQRRAAVEKELNERIVGDGRDSVGAEIRARLHAMPKGEAAMKIADAARLGDRRTVAAALSAPAWISGIDEKQRATIMDVAQRTLEPDASGLLADIDANLARLEAANRVFVERTAERIREWRDNDDSIIAEKLGAVS